MVGVVGGAGAGLKVSGGLDTSMIERGFDRVRQSFEGVKGQAKSFTSDLTRMHIASSGLVTKLASVGAIGVSAIVGLASKAPAVAGSMAKIGVETDKLIRTLGKQFAPEFAKVSEMYSKFVNFVEAHPDLTKAFVFGSIAVIGFAAATKFIGVISAFIAPVGLLPILTAITAIIAAGGIGAAIGEAIGEKTYKEGGISEDVARFIVERPTLRAGIEAYAGLGGAVVDFFKGLINVDKENNRKDQLLTPPTDQIE